MERRSLQLGVFLLSLSPMEVKAPHRAGDPGEAPLQLQRFSENVLVMRQSKSVHYEAPFMYLLFGEKKALLLDTGAKVNSTFPLGQTVESLMHERYGARREEVQLIVAHTHGHSDHLGGDSQFASRPGTQLLSPNEAPLFFGIKNWPSDIGSLDLGDRTIDVIPIPGHEGRDLAFYDQESRMLFSGDSVLPGRIYIRNWPLFRQSIDRLVSFVASKPVDYILGAHIELGVGGLEYPAGTLIQEEELPLPLEKSDLLLMQKRVKALESAPQREVLPHFILVPLPASE